MAAAVLESPASDIPKFAPLDYVKFFGAGALAATLTHGVSSPIHLTFEQSAKSSSFFF